MTIIIWRGINLKCTQQYFAVFPISFLRCYFRHELILYYLVVYQTLTFPFTVSTSTGASKPAEPSTSQSDASSLKSCTGVAYDSRPPEWAMELRVS